MSASEEQSQGPVIRDRRRIDPVTGQPRETAQPGPAPAGQGSAGPSSAGPSSAGTVPRGASQPRPGKHAVSKPGSIRPEVPAAAAAADPGTNGPDQAGSADGRPAGGNGADLAVKLAERTADLQRLQAEYANYRKRVERDRAAVREHALASVITELLPVLDDIGRAREHSELTGGFKAVAESLEAAVGKLGLTTFGEAGEPFDPNVHEALMHSYSADVTEPTCVQVLQPGYKVGERILRPVRVAVAGPTDPAGVRTPSTATAPDESQDAGPASPPASPGASDADAHPVQDDD